ncbi:MAG: hypothetical protein B7C24_06720 [Bacteroidetes bacterium 4572_77]|nr:MAG: hypothetical protein B7C24_06720 [Bacteroidetes bacterium 4572_77]
MKKDEVPQDDANLLEGRLTEPCYATDENGNYTTVQSVGWDAKNVVIQQAWEDVNQQIEDTKQQVLLGHVSPISYYMHKALMDTKILADYTGFFRWTVKKHLKMKHFNKLSDHKLQKYADVFQITLQALKNKELL